MNPMLVTWLLLFGAIGCEIVATLSLRASEGFTKLVWAPLVVIGYCLCFWFLSLTLKRGMPVALAYGVWSCVGIVITAVLAHFLFRDVLNWQMFIGMAIIIVGIAVLQWATTLGATA